MLTNKQKIKLQYPNLWLLGKILVVVVAVLLTGVVFSDEANAGEVEVKVWQPNGGTVYVVSLIGDGLECPEKGYSNLLEVRWTGLRYRCTEAKGGLRIMPSTRFGKRLLKDAVENTRAGEYVIVSNVLDRDIRKTLDN